MSQSTSTGLKPIARRKLSGEVLDRLLGLIETRAIPPGGSLPSERELMRDLGVGRPAVREALQALAAMGLAHIQHGERAKVVDLQPGTVLDQIDRSVRHLLQTSKQTLDHLRDARLMFESGMVRLAARTATPADIETLTRALERQEAARGDAARFIAADIAFHRTIAGISGNPIYAAVSEALLQWLFEFYPRSLRVPGTEPLTLREHRAILKQIAARQEERAVAALHAHLTRANPLYAKRRAAPA